MKKVVQVQEIDGEGLEAFLGKRIFILAMSYFYEGVLTGVNKTCILLEGEPRIVLDSGSFEGNKIDYSEKIKGGKLYIQLNAIESFFESHKA